MDVRMKFGRYNGEIRDIEPVAARAMLVDGRAERPDAQREREISAASASTSVKPVRRAKR